MLGVPVPGLAPSPADPPMQARRRHALGWGLCCPALSPGADLGRDLVLAAGPGGLRDLSVIEGMDNLVQGLQLALTTALGADPFNTEFGFDGIRVLAQEADPALARERVRVAVIHVLRRDARVRAISDVSLADAAAASVSTVPGGTAPTADAGQSPVDAWRTAQVRCVVETASSDPVTLTVDGVIPRG
jgi:phage baseplate assembly protein W